MTFVDEVDSQFKQSIASFSESTAELAAYAGRFQKDCKNDRLVFSTDAPQGQH
jgi:hypothetical protein